MAALVWDKIGERFYETGVSNVALYLQDEQGEYPEGVAWNGVTAVTESPSGAEPTALYADNIKYLNLLSPEEFALTLEAYTYPDAFDECQGVRALIPGVKVGQQPHVPFGLAYITQKGNDTAGSSYGEIIHLVYNCLAAPTERAHNTINDSPEAITLSWEISTTPVAIAGMAASAHITIDTTTTDLTATQIAALKKVLFGDTSATAKLPLPEELDGILNPTPVGP